MSFGLQIQNPAGEFVLSSDAKGLHCIGRATLVGSVVQPSGSATGGFPGRTAGYSIYRIAHDGPIVVAADLPIGKNVAVISITQPFAGSWDIRVHCGDTPDGFSMDTIEYALDVWAFGLFTTPAGGYGLQIRDAAGALAWDLARPNPLFARAFINGFSGPATIPSLTRPVAVGLPSTWQVTDQFISFNHRARVTDRGALRRTSATSLSDVLSREQRFEYFGPEGNDHEGDVFPTYTFIIEGATLP